MDKYEKVVRQMIADGQISQDVAEKYFPELKESEDEKMRKIISDILLTDSDEIREILDVNNVLMQDVYAWLENQGEKPQGKSALEAVNEEKVDNANKVEPKFHKDDWIYIEEVSFHKQGPFKITEVNDCAYCFENRDTPFPIIYQDLMTLWTIQDARDGDVLATLDYILIFKRLLDNNGGESYCHFGALNPQFDFNNNKNWYFGKEAKISPATKEQRDTLMKVMKEAGYHWDAEKKELKKILVPIFHIGDTIAKKHNSDINDFGSFTITDITGGKYWYNDRIICDISEQDGWELYEPIRQNSTKWSKEDEIRLNRIVENLELLNVADGDILLTDIEWLKSLKPQTNITDEEFIKARNEAYNDALDKIEYHSDTPTFNDGWSAAIWYLKKRNVMLQTRWKPSDEQLKELKNVFSPDTDSWDEDILRELYKQLKQL